MAAGPASASTASVSGSTLTYTAGHEANTISLRTQLFICGGLNSCPHYVIADTATVTAGSGCFLIGVEAFCRAESISKITLSGGAGNDTVSVTEV